MQEGMEKRNLLELDLFVTANDSTERGMKMQDDAAERDYENQEKILFGSNGTDGIEQAEEVGDVRLENIRVLGNAEFNLQPEQENKAATGQAGSILLKTLGWLAAGAATGGVGTTAVNMLLNDDKVSPPSIVRPVEDRIGSLLIDKDE